MRISRQPRENCTHNEQLYNSYSSLNVTNITKLWMMGWLGYIACTGDRKNTQNLIIQC